MIFLGDRGVDNSFRAECFEFPHRYAFLFSCGMHITHRHQNARVPKQRAGCWQIGARGDIALWPADAAQRSYLWNYTRRDKSSS